MLEIFLSRFLNDFLAAIFPNDLKASNALQTGSRKIDFERSLVVLYE